MRAENMAVVAPKPTLPVGERWEERKRRVWFRNERMRKKL